MSGELGQVDKNAALTGLNRLSVGFDQFMQAADLTLCAVLTGVAHGLLVDMSGYKLYKAVQCPCHGLINGPCNAAQAA
jgi:hypothetical protein